MAGRPVFGSHSRSAGFTLTEVSIVLSVVPIAFMLLLNSAPVQNPIGASAVHLADGTDAVAVLQDNGIKFFTSETFQQPSLYTTPNYSELVQGIDLKGNSTSGERGFAVLYSNSAGYSSKLFKISGSELASGTTASTGLTLFSDSTAADVSGDGREDLIVISPQTIDSQFRLSVLPAHSDGSRLLNGNVLLVPAETQMMMNAPEREANETPSMKSTEDEGRDGGRYLANKIDSTSQSELAVEKLKYAQSTSIPPGLSAVTTAQLNGAGPQDIIIAGGDAYLGQCFVQALLDVNLGTNQPADGPRTYLTVGPTIHCATDIVATDFNNDGKPDVIVSSTITTANNKGTVLALRGLGNGFFATPQVYEVGKGPGGLSIIDFDSDGKSDVAIATAQELTPTGMGKMSLLRNISGSTMSFQTAEVDIAQNETPLQTLKAKLSSGLNAPQLAVLTYSSLRLYGFGPL